MKRLMYSISGLLLLVSMTILNSCKNDDDSAFQPKGNYGNAKMNSKTFKNVGWTQDASIYACIINDADITKTIVDNGQVNVYMEGAPGFWETLPYFWPITATYGGFIAVQYS
jgi:hypothetical protein